ncbi:hypothetical protein SAMD00019534_113930 [Acytostelium subglobosum LB1]|uniref:hypothetical protein n=1 Tax=Acytostelium subglobosum LB1 TaxID=1410327 RepID=UPI000644BD1F|nr:hypothetical protein SAMD00019534_113930 [Acytostelium subglobosum LB1]GAM28217.1 hypothetical protein SAMD00019534_113930 [Acytostelium subglobosum LB1]|eukprot:XP_012748851.1 hypothetical protein SAMD00019534_113930 [Acytostelium subglobosum LB1]
MTGHFEQLIKVIMAQEYRVKKPIDEQMENMQSTINDIINEIKDINHITNMEYPQSIDHMNNNDGETTEDTLYWMQLHYLKDHVYLVDYERGIWSFNLNTFVQKYVIDGEIKGYLGSCIDGDDNIYILSNRSFKRYSVSNKQATTLQLLPYPDIKDLDQCSPMIFVPSFGVGYLGGSGKNFIYSVSDGTWSLIKDNDTAKKRENYGSCWIPAK